MPSYTYRQVMETDYQSLWEGAQKYVEHLAQVQAQIIDVLPKYKSLLPNEFIELKGERHRRIYSTIFVYAQFTPLETKHSKPSTNSAVIW